MFPLSKMKVICIALFFLLNFSLSAQIFQSKDFHLSLEPSISYSKGVLNESIYHSTDTSKKISLLEWEKELFFYGLKIDGSFKNLHLKAGFESSIPTASGEMRDSDWISTVNYDMKTTYSVGTNYADQNFNSSLALSYDFEVGQGFFISPEIQANYLFDSFYREKGAKGWYGHSDYSSDGKNHWWYEEEAQEFPYVNTTTGKTRKLAGIDYFRHTFYLWTGLTLAFRYRRLYSALSFLVSPYTYFSAEDRHHSSGEDKVYHSIQEDCFTSYKAGLKIVYGLSRYFDLTLNASILFAREITGDLYYEWSKYKFQPSGSSTKETCLSLGCRVKIF
ncbi:MAG: omptin family outer membrane protease [Treponema sp.]|nr:omptin family outer membrane protease [Treponema sp.]